jgi:tol-pal system protein YbgF
VVERKTVSLLWAVAAIGAMVLTSGCVLPDQMTKIQKDVADLQARLQRIEREQQESREKLDRIAEAVSEERDQVTRTEFADLKLHVDETVRGASVVGEQVQQVNRRMDLLSHNVQENREMIRRMSTASPAAIPDPGIGSIPGAEPPSGGDGGSPSAVPGAEALYNAAYTDFSKGNYALAISGFEEYANQYPESDLADNALYWIGECYFSQGNYGVALGAFDRMLERYPQSDRAAAANLKKGLGYLEQNQIQKAIIQLRYVQDSYPGSDEARIAADKLASLGVVGR